MGTNFFKVIAILGRNYDGTLERRRQTVQINDSDDLTVIPTVNGIIVVTDSIQDKDQPFLTRLLGELIPIS